MQVDVQARTVREIVLPTDRAMTVLRGSRYDRKRGIFYHGGAPLSSQELIRRANAVLRSRNQDPIEYPGL